MTVDLTKIEKPFGLLDKETQDAMLAHRGVIEWLSVDGWGPRLHAGSLSYNLVYRAAPQPVRGEVVYHGSLNPIYSLHPEDTYRNPNEPARVTLPTLDGKLVPGTYTGPDGATVKIEVL